MSASQKQALKRYRDRLTARGLARFEVLGRDEDRDLIRSLASRLAEEGPDASSLRARVHESISDEPPRKVGILEALLKSPLVGAELDVSRPKLDGRQIEF